MDAEEGSVCVYVCVFEYTVCRHTLNCLVVFVARTDTGGTAAGWVKDLPAYHPGSYQPGQLVHSAVSLDRYFFSVFFFLLCFISI